MVIKLVSRDFFEEREQGNWEVTFAYRNIQETDFEEHVQAFPSISTLTLNILAPVFGLDCCDKTKTYIRQS